MGRARRLESENVVVSSPTSFKGSTGRWNRQWEESFNWLKDRDWHPALYWPLAASIGVVLAFLLLIYWVVAAVFTLATWPYRLIRRGARKRKMEGLEHRELLDTIEPYKVTPHKALRRVDAGVVKEAQEVFGVDDIGLNEMGLVAARPLLIAGWYMPEGGRAVGENNPVC